MHARWRFLLTESNRSFEPEVVSMHWSSKRGIKLNTASVKLELQIGVELESTVLLKPTFDLNFMLTTCDSALSRWNGINQLIHSYCSWIRSKRYYNSYTYKRNTSKLTITGMTKGKNGRVTIFLTVFITISLDSLKRGAILAHLMGLSRKIWASWYVMVLGS